VAAVLIPVILACTSVTALDRAPAPALRITVIFTGVLIPGATTSVTVLVNDAHNNPVAFTGGQRLTINGIMIPEQDSGQHTPPLRKVTVPRVVAGTNTYTFVYDDGRGHRTEVQIPGPRTDFAILQPAPGSHVPLPRLVRARDTGGQPAATPVPYGPRPSALAHTPLTVHYALPFLPQDLRSSAGTVPSINANLYTVNFLLNGVCASQWPRCSGIPSSVGQQGTVQAAAVPTGTWSIGDSGLIWGAGFETLGPGPGSINAGVRVGWNVPGTGFDSFYVEFGDSLRAPITWVRA
jgi:hypothetical protein